LTNWRPVGSFGYVELRLFF